MAEKAEVGCVPLVAFKVSLKLKVQQLLIFPLWKVEIGSLRTCGLRS